MNIKNEHVLVTGGAGFIGSHLVEALLRKGVEVTVIDNLDDFYPSALKKANLAEVHRIGKFDFLETDICDYARMRDAFARRPPSVVAHLAARAGVRPSIESPRLYETVNIAGTTNVLELCREFRVSKLIFGSSSSVYGLSSQVPFSEDCLALKPISPYAATKLSGELLCFTYSHLFHLPVVCLRFFTVYGPRQRPDLAIHKFTALLEAGQPIPIYGDGSTGRDYTNVVDIVAGILAAMEFEFGAGSEAPFETFNLGNSHPIRLSELVEALERVTSTTAIRVQCPAQAGDVSLTWADISKAKKLLRYYPSTPFGRGLEQFVDWYRVNHRIRVT